MCTENWARSSSVKKPAAAGKKKSSCSTAREWRCRTSLPVRSCMSGPLSAASAGSSRSMREEAICMSARRLLLISNSTMCGRGYLAHAVDEIRDLLGGNRRIVFVPFALSDRAAYTSRARKRLGQIGYQVMDAGDLVPGTDVVFDAFFVGGGNTFR